MELEQVTIPEGMVNGPDRVLPRKCVFNGYYNSVLLDEIVDTEFYNEISGNGAVLDIGCKEFQKSSGLILDTVP